MRRLVLTLLLVTACSSTSAPVASVSPLATFTGSSPAPSPSASAVASSVLAVFYDGSAATLAIGDSNAKVVASTSATAPHRYNQGLPWTSTSMTRVYFLDSSGDVRFLTRAGSTGVATHIGLTTGQEAGFAVSPDDQKIAVAVLTYPSASAYGGTRMYVEDLPGGGNHVDIYSSSVNAEFPIGWTEGRLIIALSTPICCQGQPLNPYGAVEYHVVDPATGNRFVTLCRGLVPAGPPTTIGVACKPPGTGPYEWYGWNGAPCCAPGTAPGPFLSPDGTQAAGVGAGTIEISGPRANFVNTTVLGEPVAWLDSTHLVYRLRSDGALYVGVVPSLEGPKVPLDGLSVAFEGTVPTTLY